MLIAVDEEALLLLDRPRVLKGLEDAAQKIGFSSVRLQAKGAALASDAGGLDEILQTAQELGVDIQNS